MFYVALDQCIKIEITPSLFAALFSLEGLFLIDFLLNFVTVTYEMESPTLANTVKNYLKGMFIFDIVALGSNFLALSSSETAEMWFIRIKLIRIARFSYIRLSYFGIAGLLSSKVPKVGKQVNFIITRLIEGLFTIHVFACVWIKLGSTDFQEDRWLDEDLADKTWMFISETDFSSDQRTIYE